MHAATTSELPPQGRQQDAMVRPIPIPCLHLFATWTVSSMAIPTQMAPVVRAGSANAGARSADIEAGGSRASDPAMELRFRGRAEEPARA